MSPKKNPMRRDPSVSTSATRDAGTQSFASRRSRLLVESELDRSVAAGTADESRHMSLGEAVALVLAASISKRAVDSEGDQ
jgi:hypothetical protein